MWWHTHRMNKPSSNPNQFVTRQELYDFGQDLAQTIIMGFETYMNDFRAELNQKFGEINQRFEAMDAKFDARFDYQEKRLDNLVDDVADIKHFLKRFGFRDKNTRLKA